VSAAPRTAGPGRVRLKQGAIGWYFVVERQVGQRWVSDEIWGDGRWTRDRAQVEARQYARLNRVAYVHEAEPTPLAKLRRVSIG
jgi:hypothetical protein